MALILSAVVTGEDRLSTEDQRFLDVPHGGCGKDHALQHKENARNDTLRQASHREEYISGPDEKQPALCNQAAGPHECA
jgi:hypothetical protein